MSLSPDLQQLQSVIEGYAREFGLDFFEVRFEMLDYRMMNQVAAYDGFPTRYPHWRFGMEYERLSKSYAYGLHRIYEMVINTDPCYAYLLASNQRVDQKLVMAHVYGHCDFFKTNQWFAHTNRKMLDEMANHAARIRRHVERHGLDRVEDFLDACLSLDNLIDIHSVAIRRRPLPAPEDDAPKTVRKLPAKGYMDTYINPPEFVAEQQRRLEEAERQRKHFPEEPERDVLLFLLEHAPLDNWQHDVLDIVREEAYYFSPQRQTKIMNEGWACVRGDSLVYTEQGLLSMEAIVEQRLNLHVSDGEAARRIYDWAKFEDHPTVGVRTRRGLEIEGSVTHRVMLADGSWRRLDEIQIGDRVRLGAGGNRWPCEYLPIDWQPQRRITLENVAAQVGVSIGTVIRYRRGVRGRHSDTLAPLVAEYDTHLDTMSLMQNKRQVIRVPDVVDERLAAFMGYLVGDGHVSAVKRSIGLTTGDEEQAECFARLVRELFDIESRKKWNDGRWRVVFSSKDVEDFLKHLGFKTGRSARIKQVPDVILCSPKMVVAAFLRAYFDCDGYAGRQGVILSTASEMLGKTVQLLLLNFGILSSRRPHKDGCWHVHITGQSATLFHAEIGFGLHRKRQALEQYTQDHQWFKREVWEDEVVAVEQRRADVYDISVTTTHRYASQGFINHNSFAHTHIMTERALDVDELIDYAEHHSGTVAVQSGHLNPYKLGLELYRDIEDRWNRGAFGADYDACDSLQARREWDRRLGLGRQKVFEVRRVYNDIGFIDEFLTEDFAREHKLFTFDYNEHNNQYEIASRKFQEVKQRLLFQLTNFGQPIVEVADGNHDNRGELYLLHRHEGIDLDVPFAEDTLRNLYTLWGRPAHIETHVKDEGRVLFSHGPDGGARRKLD